MLLERQRKGGLSARREVAYSCRQARWCVGFGTRCDARGVESSEMPCSAEGSRSKIDNSGGADGSFQVVQRSWQPKSINMASFLMWDCSTWLTVEINSDHIFKNF